ncbi:MAG: tetratricopeptide repeat protein [candidate division Zixibacteria bacterium]|nr:tetratricopeptide repeat protein [candidate division Zixibacteria bacterium]
MTAFRLLQVVCISLFLFTSLLIAGTLDHNFETGNDYYSNGDYKGAIAEYEKVIQAGYQSPELYYNLGNSYFREGLLGQAIGNYIRAKRLDPRDDDIEANLSFARKFAIDKMEVTEETVFFEYINRFFDSFSLKESTWLSGILLIILISVIITSRIYRRIHIASPFLVLLIVVFATSSIITGVKLDRDVLTRTGVVIFEQIEVQNGPGEDYNVQFTAHAGLICKIEREESGYYLVNFENRLKGWISTKAVSEI